MVKNRDILITGSKGFIGKNLVERVSKDNDFSIYEFYRQSTIDELKSYIENIDFIFHLAGEVRPSCTKEEFNRGNIGFTKELIELLESRGLKIPILVASSVHADNPKNDYGHSKKISDEIIMEYAKRDHTKAYIFRLPHLFGEHCRPNHNSAISTWIYNSINDLPINIYSRDIEISYTYVQDFIDDALEMMSLKYDSGLYRPKIIYKTTLGEVYDILTKLKQDKCKLDSDFKKKLSKVYSWYKENHR